MTPNLFSWIFQWANPKPPGHRPRKTQETEESPPTLDEPLPNLTYSFQLEFIAALWPYPLDKVVKVLEANGCLARKKIVDQPCLTAATADVASSNQVRRSQDDIISTQSWVVSKGSYQGRYRLEDSSLAAVAIRSPTFGSKGAELLGLSSVINEPIRGLRLNQVFDISLWKEGRSPVYIGVKGRDETFVRKALILMFIVEPVFIALVVPRWRPHSDRLRTLHEYARLTYCGQMAGGELQELTTLLGEAKSSLCEEELNFIGWLWSCNIDDFGMAPPHAGDTPLSFSFNTQRKTLEFRDMYAVLDERVLVEYIDLCLALVKFAGRSQFAMLRNAIISPPDGANQPNPDNMKRLLKLLFPDRDFESQPHFMLRCRETEHSRVEWENENDRAGQGAHIYPLMNAHKWDGYEQKIL